MSHGVSESGRESGYTLKQAIDDVFGTWPLAPWSQVVIIVAGGLAGAVASSWLRPATGIPAAEFRWAACAGYGLIIAALMTQLPRLVQLCRLWRTRQQRPARDDRSAAPRWPLRLLAAALRGLPLQRIVQSECALAVDRTAKQTRELLSQRMWPACVAAFTAPVLGLLSAWESGSQVVRESMPDAGAGDVYVQFLMQVSPPMIATISTGLGLMVFLVVLDQFTKALLQRWAVDVTLTDKDDPFIMTTCGDGGGDGPAASRSPIHGASVTSGPPAPVDSSTSRPLPPQIDPDDLERLKELFPSR
jgi:hypothetical protein